MYRHHLTMVNYTLNVGTGRIWLCSQLLHYIQITPYFIFWSNPVLLNWRSAVFLHPTVSVLWLQINKGKVPCNLLRHWSREVLGRDPWSCGYGRRLMFWRLWVRIPAPYTGWTLHFFTLTCCKNCIACLKRLKINEKEAGILSIFLKKTMEVPTLLVLLFEAVINLFYRPLIISDRVLFYLTKRNDLFRHFSFYPWILEQWICKC